MEHLFRKHIRASDPVVVIGGHADCWSIGCAGNSPISTFAGSMRRLGCVTIRRRARRACSSSAQNPAPFVFLAVGSPQQEMIAHEARLAGDCTGVALCCGAALEFLTGMTARAPQWMRTHRLEWLYRLAAEPGRLWQRYLVDGPRIFLHLASLAQPRASRFRGRKWRGSVPAIRGCDGRDRSGSIFTGILQSTPDCGARLRRRSAG